MPKLLGLDENLNRAGDTVRNQWQRGKISLFERHDKETPPRVRLHWDKAASSSEGIDITAADWETLQGEAKCGA